MDTEQKRKQFVDLLARFTAYTSKHLPDDVLDKLTEMQEQEKTDLAKSVYDAMFENLKIANETDSPLCQDTGIIQYYVQVGTGFPLINELEDCLLEALKQATALGPLRPNAVEVFDEKNTGDNTGTRIPWVEYEIVPNSDEIKIFVYPAGGGCSLPGAAKVLMPSDGYEGVAKFVFDQISSYGVNACPPLLVGIGIAGSMDVAAKLSKKALLRFIGSHNSNPLGAEFEIMIEEGLNQMKIGPNGLGGEFSVMGVHVEQAARHPATRAVAVSVGCWAHRRALIKIDAEMNYEVLSHKGVTL